MRKWTHIMIHHSLTKDSKTVSWNAIKKYHTKVLGWKDIGYHFGVEKVKDGYVILVGRPLLMSGAHCKEAGMNYKAIGICVIGNYDCCSPSSNMLAELCYRLIIPLMDTFNIPIENIVFHRDFARYKSCPGKKFLKWKFRVLLKNLLKDKLWS